VLPRLSIGKAEHEQTCPWFQQPGESPDVGHPAGIVEHMKQPAVGGGVEPFRNLADGDRIHLEKVHR
jgi:hypothetical protein